MISNEDKCNKKEANIQEIQTKTVNRVAVLSFAIGILSIPFAFLSFKSNLILIPFGLSVLSAPILGVIALIQITLNKGALRGRLIAILGICASPVSVICFFSYWITHFTLPA